MLIEDIVEFKQDVIKHSKQFMDKFERRRDALARQYNMAVLEMNIDKKELAEMKNILDLYEEIENSLIDLIST